MISEFCPQVYKSVTWNLDETMKWIRCVWIFVIPSMTSLHFLKRGWKGFFFCIYFLSLTFHVTWFVDIFILKMLDCICIFERGGCWKHEVSNNCCIQFTLLNPSTGVSVFFENFQRGAVEGGWFLVGLFQGCVCHLPVRCLSVLEIVLCFWWDFRSYLTAMTLNLEKSGV